MNIEPRTTRIMEAREKIENLAYKLSQSLDVEPKMIFNEYTGEYKFKRYNPDNPDGKELNGIIERLISICDYIDDDVLPSVQYNIEEEEAEEALIAAVI